MPSSWVHGEMKKGSKMVLEPMKMVENAGKMVIITLRHGGFLDGFIMFNQPNWWFYAECDETSEFNQPKWVMLIIGCHLTTNVQQLAPILSIAVAKTEFCCVFLASTILE